MERGSPRRFAYDIGFLALALAVGEATRDKFVEAGGLVVVAAAAIAWATRARPTRRPTGPDRMLAHPARWALIYLVTIGPATFYLTDGTVLTRYLAIRLAASVVVPLVVFAVRWSIVRRGGPD